MKEKTSCCVSITNFEIVTPHVSSYDLEPYTLHLITVQFVWQPDEGMLQIIKFLENTPLQGSPVLDLPQDIMDIKLKVQLTLRNST